MWSEKEITRAEDSFFKVNKKLEKLTKPEFKLSETI